MPKRMYSEQYIEAIADAIRSKNKKTDKYTVEQMAPAILALGGGLKETDVDIKTAEYTTSNL